MEDQKKRNGKRTLYVIVMVLAIANLAFKFLNEIKIEQTAILFVGIPALITLLLIKHSQTPKTLYGIVFKTVTIFLLMSSILLGEGLVCIIIMAPIFYMVAGLIVLLINLLKKNDKTKLNSYIIIPALLIVSQSYEIATTPRLLNVKTTVEVPGHHSLASFNATPDFLEDYPTFFKIGFPKPIAIKGKGIDIGDYRKIEFKSNTKGIGTLHLEVKDKTKNTITFKVVGDDTHISHWLTWKEIMVSIENHDDNTSSITWTTIFNCDLGPSWYFEPTEKYGVKIMNEHLINSFFLY